MKDLRREIKVIVAENDPDTVNTISMLLEKKGITVIGKAYDGKEASVLYFTHKPDVILIDLIMANYDGHYAIEKIKRKDPNAKIIVISSYLYKHFQSNKVSAVFLKPYDIYAIGNKIKEIANS